MMMMTLLSTGVKRRLALGAHPVPIPGLNAGGEEVPASRRRRGLVDTRCPTTVCRAPVCPLTPFQIPGGDHGGGRQSGNAEL